MSDSQVTNKGGTDRVLTGQSNWIRWYPGFKADARADDTWSLLDGSESIITKPQRAAYLQSAVAASNATPEPAKDNDDTANTLPAKATGPEVARYDLFYKQSLDLYCLDLHDYEQQHERVRRANKMLHDRIDPSMQAEIEDKQVPANALAHLQTQYRMQDSRAIQLAHDEIDSLTLGTCKDMTEYVNKMRQLKNDLAYLGDSITDTRFIAKLIKGLPSAYFSWVERYHDIVADPDANNPSLKSVEAQLISKEATLPKTKERKGK